MKHFMLAASAFALFSAPAHAQLLGGSGGLGGTLNGTANSTLRGSIDTLRSTTRGTLRGDAATRGDQKVDRRSGDVSVDRTLDAGLDATAGQLVESSHGSAGGDASASGKASGSGSANAQLIGTDAVRATGQDTLGRAGDGVSHVRNLATPAVGSARERASGLAGGAGTLSGAASGAASGAGSVGNSLLAVAGSGAAEGEGTFAVAPGMPVALPSGEHLGTVRDIMATRSGQIRQLVVQTRDGLTKIPANDLSAQGSALVAGSTSGSVSEAQPKEKNRSE